MNWEDSDRKAGERTRWRDKFHSAGVVIAGHMAAVGIFRFTEMQQRANLDAFLDSLGDDQ